MDGGKDTAAYRDVWMPIQSGKKNLLIVYKKLSSFQF